MILSHTKQNSYFQQAVHHSGHPKTLIPILNYMNGRKADSSFTKKIDDAIKLEKNIETERMSYMTYEMKIREFEQAGYHHGIQDGRREGIREGRREGIREGQL